MAKGVHTIDKDNFFKAYEEWSQNGVNLRKAAKIAGVCDKTLVKYFGMLIKGEPLPDTLFTQKTTKRAKK